MRPRITFTTDTFWADVLRRGAEKSGMTLSGYVESLLRSELFRLAGEQHTAWLARHPNFYEDAEAERIMADQLEEERVKAERRAS